MLLVLCDLRCKGSSSTPDKELPNANRQNTLAAGNADKTAPNHISNQPVNEGGNDSRTGDRRTGDRTGNSDVTYSRRELEGRKPVDLDRWHIKFDGSGRDMTVESFIFRIEKMREQYNILHNQLFSDLVSCYRQCSKVVLAGFRRSCR